MSEICPRCCQDVEKLVEPACEDEPELVRGKHLYPCNDCGMPVMAGDPHPLMCEECVRRTR